ncbi:MAG: phenylacetic acid degradation protein PaaN [Chitinophagaceae bacterium]|nr:MAG: phenylacetic acid degradation protein PaaN [Chitinophagaceae bacterium]
MLFEKYQSIIENADRACHLRGFYSQYPDHPKAYGEEALVNGEKHFKNMLNHPFDTLLQDGADEWQGEEVSPYTGKKSGITYPVFPVETLIHRAKQSVKAWIKTPVKERAAVLVNSLENIKDRFFEIAYATMHTTGQSFIMSFQASGPHAADRALEAIAMGYHELTRFPDEVLWEKPIGKQSVILQKTFRPVPKGIGVVIGCSTFPVWNSVPGIYADLMTGNPAIVKPHPGAVLPIAIVIEEIQKTLEANGLDPHLCQLAADTGDHPIAKELCGHPAVKLIDYTGSTAFGNYIESLKNKTVFTEKAGVNSVILDSVQHIEKVAANLAFSACLYSGQMCTAPQNFFIPASGVDTPQGKLSYKEATEKIKDAIDQLVNDPKAGAGTLGAVQNDKTIQRAQSVVNDKKGAVILQGTAIQNPEFEHARTLSPAIIETDAAGVDIYQQEFFGPVVVIIKTKDTEESLRLAKQMAAMQGAITCAAYTTNDQMMKRIADEMNEVFTPVTFNLTGFIWVNQHAAFSDFHVTGGNPAGNAGFTDPLFVDRRFVWVGNRIMK